MPDQLEQHLFLSYAHRDNEPLIAGQAGWVERFQQALSVRLGQLLGREPKVWWDRQEIQGNEIFSGVIDDGLVRSAVLVPLISPSYQNSAWCQKELDSFCAAAEKAGGWRIGNRARIFKVVKTPVPYDEQPEELQGLLGYEFFRKDPATGRIQELRVLDPQRPDPDYMQKIDDLAQDISQLVEDLLEAGSPAGPPAGPPPPALYLAECTSDLAAERDQLQRAMKQLGFRVLPEHPLPSLGSELRRQAAEALAGARLSVHLIGANYGVVPEAETESIAEIQSALATTRGEADPSFSRLVWLRPGADIRDPRQQALVARLRDVPAGQRGVEILAGSLEALQVQIELKLKPPPAKAAAPVPAAAGGDHELRYVYLLHDAKDAAAAAALGNLLFGSSPQIEVVLPLPFGEAADLRAFHEGNLVTCDGVLFYWGEAGETWLRSRLLDLRKAPGLGRGRPFAAAGVFVAGPTAPAKDNFRSREAPALRPGAEGELAALAPFIAELLAGEGDK
jgi:hypothetical protein